MKIGVLSDTHIPITAVKIPDFVIEAFDGCDLIIHAGDIVDEQVIKTLEEIAETKVVHGNMDSAKIREKYPEKMILDLEGIKVGVTHGKGASVDAVRHLKKIFKNDKLDAVIFGHTHQVYNKTIDGTLFFNPGSPTDMVFSDFHSCGIIEIEGKNIKGRIIEEK